MSNPGNKLQNPTTQSLFSTVTSTRERGLQSVQWCTNHPTWSAIRCKFAFPNASQSHTCSCSSTSLLTLPLVLCRNIVLVRLSLQRIWSNKFRRILHHSYIWWPLAPSPANERHVHPWNWNRFLLQHGTVLLFTTNLLRPEKILWRRVNINNYARSLCTLSSLLRADTQTRWIKKQRHSRLGSATSFTPTVNVR